MGTGFTAEEIRDGVCARTEYVPARRGVRPHRRCLVAAPTTDAAGATATFTASVAGPGATRAADEVVTRAMRVLWVLARQGQDYTSEKTLRGRLRGHLDSGQGSEVLLDLVRLGWVTIEQTLTPVGDVKRSIIRLTPAGRQAVESRFGSLEPDARGLLLRQIESWLSSCRRPQVGMVLRRQAEALARGDIPVLRTGPGPEEGLAWHPAERARRYEKVLAFLALLGSLPEWETLDFREAASRLFPGQVDSVKALEDVRPLIAAAVRYELGCELEEAGVTADTLYSLMFCGVLVPDGSDPLWGEVACLSTYDLKRIPHLHTPAHTLLMVENAAPLAAAARDGLGREGYLVAYLGGMPQSAFFQFLTKLKAPALQAALLWVDWDMGGLRILRYLRQHWPSHLPDLQVVPHPHACPYAAVDDYSRAREARLRFPSPGKPQVTAVGGCPSPGKPQVTAVRREEVPESYLESADPLVAGFAAGLREYGCLYQEEVLSIYRDLLPPRS
ncbi:MAG: DUF2399 domain-containing protein [Bacillota bacterium]|nr:DUF2399 domain-containing protein [Bacillota bacterium]